MGSQTPPIPQELRDRLESLRDVLEVNACVQPRYADRPDGRWRLRFRMTVDGRRKHAGISIRDRHTATAVKTLIDSWQVKRQRELDRRKEEASHEREAEKRKRKERILLRKLAIELGGGGERRRKRTARAFDEAAAKGPVGLYEFAMSEAWSCPSPRGGRPPASALW